MSNIIDLIDVDKTSLEIFDFVDNIKPNLYNVDKLDYKFYLYLSDNDGPSVIINKNFYNIADILKALDKILTL